MTVSGEESGGLQGVVGRERFLENKRQAQEGQVQFLKR